MLKAQYTGLQLSFTDSGEANSVKLMENESFETRFEVDEVYARLFAKEAAPFVFTYTALMLTQVFSALLFTLTLYFYATDAGPTLFKLSPIFGVLTIEFLTLYLYNKVVKNIQKRFINLIDGKDKVYYQISINDGIIKITNSKSDKSIEFPVRSVKKFHETENFIILESGKSKLFGFYKELDPEQKVKSLITKRS